MEDSDSDRRPSADLNMGRARLPRAIGQIRISSHNECGSLHDPIDLMAQKPANRCSRVEIIAMKGCVVVVNNIRDVPPRQP